MAERLKCERVAILATDGFEPLALEEPEKAPQRTGATAEVVSPTAGQNGGWNRTERGNSGPVDVELDRAHPARYGALVLPGGVMNPDAPRASRGALGFVRVFVSATKLIATICHEPWSLFDAAGVRGRPMTSWSSLQADLENPGAAWVAKEISEGRRARHASAARA